jgi:hypothetical protein
MIGSGFFNGQIIKKRLHMDCFLRAQERALKEWFFANDYKPTKMPPEKRKELHRLGTKIYYIKKRGGEHVVEKIAEVEKQIAFVKADSKQ